MSWEPVTLWSLRCDGDTTAGQCAERYHHEDEDGDRDLALLRAPSLTPLGIRSLQCHRWLFTGRRLLCPQHVAALEYLAAAQLDGLPFDETTAHTTASEEPHR